MLLSDENNTNLQPSPSTGEELDAWIAERKANFPHKAKIEAKQASVKAQTAEAKETAEAKVTNEKDALLIKQEQKAEKLRKQLEKVESSIKRKREQQDEGDELRESEELSSPSTISKSDDEQPEVSTTRPVDTAGVPPVARKADQSKHCKYYSTGGNCGKRGKCRFVHDPEERQKALKERELNGGRITLKQRLTLDDKEKDDLFIVRSLKYLQDKGAYKKKTPAVQSSDGPQPHATGPASLPQNPLKREPQPDNSSTTTPASKYPGWNLSGFGNTGVRPNDK